MNPPSPLEDDDKNWTKDNIKNLIEMYQSYQNLYDSKHKLYHNKHLREDSLNKLVVNLNAGRNGTKFTKSDIKKKVLSLRTTLNKERKLVENSKKSGMGTEALYEPTVWWYESFLYMVPHLKSRKSESPLEMPFIQNRTSYSSAVDESQDFFDINQYSSDHSEVHTEAHTEARPSKKQKTMNDNYEENILKNTTDILATAVKSLNESKDNPVDEIAAFGKYLTAEMQFIKDKKILLELKQDITQCLFEARAKELNLEL